MSAFWDIKEVNGSELYMHSELEELRRVAPF
jgi:hypothetical protein